MKVLLVSSVFPPEIGGPSGQTFHLARMLAEQGHNVSVATLQPNPEVPDGVSIHSLRLPRGHREGRGRLFFGYSHVVQQLWQLVRTFDPNIIHCQTGVNALALVAGLVARMRGVPSLVKFAGDPVWERYGKNVLRLDYELLLLHCRNPKVWVLRRMGALGFSLYDKIWSTSRYQGRILDEGYHVKLEKIFQCPNLSYLEPFRQIASCRDARTSNRIPLVLVVSRFVPWKNIDDSIRTFAQVRQKAMAHMRIVGGGSNEEMNRLRDLVRDLGLRVGDDVIFEGAVSPTRVASHYRDADVFLSNTTYEPFGIVFVEAMASGLKVVAPRVGGIPEILQNLPGAYMFSKGNIDEAADCLIEAIRSSSSATDNHRKFLWRFDLKQNLTLISDVYSSII